MKNSIYIILLIPTILFSQGSIIWDTDFESVQWSVNGNPAADIWETNGAVVTQRGNAREGSFCIELAAQPGTIRNELNVDNLMSVNTPTWIGFSFKILEPVPNFRIVKQLREVPTNSTNVLSIRCREDSQLEFETSTNPDYADVTVGSGAGWGSESVLVDYTLDQWHDVVIYMDSDYLDGALKIWFDGELIVNKVNTTTHYRRTTDGTIKSGIIYPKIGPYQSGAGDFGIIHYDTYKVWEGEGGTYEDVSPLGLSPGSGVDPDPQPIPNTEKRIKKGKLTTIDY